MLALQKMLISLRKILPSGGLVSHQDVGAGCACYVRWSLFLAFKVTDLDGSPLRHLQRFEECKHLSIFNLVSHGGKKKNKGKEKQDTAPS